MLKPKSLKLATYIINNNMTYNQKVVKLKIYTCPPYKIL